MSEVEREAEDGAWDNWVRHDYERALVSALNEDCEYSTDETHDFRGSSGTIDVDRIKAATTLADLGLKSGEHGATTMPAEGE